MAVETSIVIRTLNEAKHLESLLKGIHAQNYKDWEIILVDSGSTDGSPEIARRYGARIFHIPSEEFTYGRSLNLGCQQALGQYLVFASGHVWPMTNNWLGNLVRPFQESSVAMVYGRQRGTDDNRLSEVHDLTRLFGPTSYIMVDEPKGNNGNAAIRHNLWLEQPFDENLPGLEDIDWARKAEANDYRVYYAADAAVYHVHEETLRQVYRRYSRESIAAKQMFPSFSFSWSDLFRGLPLFILKDIIYAYRHRKKRKLFQVPTSRIAQFLGIYCGVRYQKRLSREIVQGMATPTTFVRVEMDSSGTSGIHQAKMPVIGPTQVVIKIAYAGVNPSDLTPNKRLPPNFDDPIRYPVVPGDNFAGIVVQTGEKVPSLRKGQKVCGFFGESQNPAENNDLGTYTEYLLTHADRTYRLPSDMPLKYGPLVQLVALCIEGLRELNVKNQTKACVLGAGPIGNLCTQILQYWGIHVTTVDGHSRRLSLLHRYDVDTLIDPIALETYDYLIYAHQEADGLANIGKIAKPSSGLLVLGHPEPISTAVQESDVTSQTIYKEAATQSKSWKEAIQLIRRGHLRLDEHTTAIMPLEKYNQAWTSVKNQQQFSLLLSGSESLEAL